MITDCQSDINTDLVYSYRIMGEMSYYILMDKGKVKPGMFYLGWYSFIQYVDKIEIL